MHRWSLAFVSLLCALSLSAQSPSRWASVLVSASASTSPATITLTWSPFSGSTGFAIYRKTKTGTNWSSIGSAGGSDTQYVDNTAVIGEYYEYKVVRSASAGTGYGYIAAGIQVPAVDSRGKLILLVESTYASPLATQLTQLENDIRGDGWGVIRHNVDNWSTVANVKSMIQADYNADPANVKAVFILGHIPVPYSGYLNPDGHGDHLGAWPADGYYGDMNGTWTDNSVSGGSGRNNNVPGDGKFDQSSFPSDLELQVGRVDFQNQGSFGYYSGISVQTLYSNYLTKLHNFKTKQFTPQFRGAVFDNFYGVGNPLAAAGYRSVSANVGHANTTDMNPSGPAFSTYVNNQSYLWTYACGGGGWTSCSNVGTTYEFATQSVIMGGVFNMSLGSYFGDWDVYDNFLIAPLCSGNALTNAWVGLPYWWFHHMGMGDNIGYSTLVSMNNGSVYSPHNSGWQGGTTNRVHMGLMGDPSLRQVMVSMPSNLQITNSGGAASFTWTAATGSPAGYYIYDLGPTATSIPVRVTPNLVTGTSFSSPTVPFISGRQYMVRAVKLETGATGTYYNLSLGAIGTASGTAQPDCLGVVGGPATIGSGCNDNNACTINDVYNSSCQCVGTNSGDSDGDGVCNASDNCPNVAGQQGSSCNDNNPCTINDVLNASCQCAGTNSPDSDGDGICNTLDNCPSIAGQQGSSCSDGNPCTTNDVLNSSCQCVGSVSPDSDGDGVCDAQDNCPNVSGQIGSACNDGNACTTNDVLNSSCQCTGTAVGDNDGDGICNAQDNCPNTFGQIGSACDDGNACTINDILDSNCQCSGTPGPDTDVDGICDAQDACPSVPGGVGSSCDDNNACTTNDVLNASCQCAGTWTDSDSDGVCDAQDNCPAMPGQIGSACDDGNPLSYNDVLDAGCACIGTVVDCNDNDPCTVDSYNGECQYSPVPDSDGDGACDAIDGCPTDAAKTSPGACGCGVSDVDSDGDATADCIDGCPNDANKIAPGQCGCGAADTDSDSDGTADCNDGCPDDPNKSAPGICGCGVSDVDTDTDGTADCFDGCPGDPNKTSPGECGCGVPEGTCIDCAGVLFGAAVVDQCGVCAGGTTGITPDASCADCAGVPNGGAAVDQCGVCSGGNTGIATNSTCADCLGIPYGNSQPGMTCDDGNAGTVNDTWSTACACIGELVDCIGIPGGSALPGSPCDDGVAGTVNDVWSNDCQCAGEYLDCEGTPGGSALPGSACDDGDASTGNDLWSAACACAGQPLDCEGVPGGNALVGTGCDDGDLDTENDLYGTDCVCEGTPIPYDCLGVAYGTALPGVACDDGDFGTGNDVWTSNCLCVGQLIDCAGVIGGGQLPGTACNDNNPNTGNDTWNGNCACVGQMIDCEGVIGGSALPGMPCNDGVNGNGVDLWTIDCNCVGNSNTMDCEGTLNGPALPGTACDDGNAGTANDLWTLQCACVGTPIDCAGVIGGTAALDECGTCAGGTTGVVPNPDGDQDGAVDCTDNCPSLANGDQLDFDGDSVGDLCDNCSWVANPDQEDGNGNGIGDACEEIGMAENSITTFNVFPNPTNGHVVITCGDASVRTIQYFDLSGKLIYSAPFAIRSDVSALAMGSYVVIALDAEGRPLARTRLVKN